MKISIMIVYYQDKHKNSNFLYMYFRLQIQWNIFKSTILLVRKKRNMLNKNYICFKEYSNLPFITIQDVLKAMIIIPNVTVTATATQGPINMTNATAKQNIRKKIMKPVDDSISNYCLYGKSHYLRQTTSCQMSRVTCNGLSFIGFFNLIFMKLMKWCKN